MFRRSATVATSAVLLALAGGQVTHAAPVDQTKASNAPSAKADKTVKQVAFVIGEPSVIGPRNWPRVSVPVLTAGRRTTIETEQVRPDETAPILDTLNPGTLVDYQARGGGVAVPTDASATFHTALSKGTRAVFDTQKYGAELAPRAGKIGNAVAAGWVYDKDKTSIAVGDGRRVTRDIAGRAFAKPRTRYEETYQVAKKPNVYEVNTSDWSASRPSTYAAVPVTRNYDYANTERQQVFVVFDKPYTKAKKAKVTDIFYFTPADVADGKPVWDVPTMSSLLAGKGTDPVSGQQYEAINATGVTNAPYTRSTEPFEMVPDTFYYVGDNEVSLYLFNADMGTATTRDDKLVLVDSGWPNSGYQYWKNIEAMGKDPRDIDTIIMPHGHSDHYGTTVELVTMIENAGGSVELLSPRADVQGLAEDAIGNVWNLPAALPASETEIRQRTGYLTYDEWMDFGNVRMLPIWSPGHTPGSTSFIFDIENPETGQRLTYGYMGGYGWSPKTVNATNGWQRLGFAYNLAWLQQRWGTVDYAAPQHANQFPLVDINQALIAYNNDPANKRRQLTMLDALTKGEFVNQLEKRYAVATNAVSDTQPGYQSIETYGPFKPGRENGATDARVKLVDGGRVLHGYDKAMNVNPRIPLLRNGIEIKLDGHVDDPDGWYIQFELDVLDSYRGFLPSVGPVESIRPEGTEILRTQRFNSRAEAESVLRTVQAGGTYTVDLTKASAIVIPTDGTPVFEPS